MTSSEPTATDRRKSGSGGFGADVLKLVTGTVLAQGITVVFSPLLTRLYAPPTFGIWALYASITTMIGVVACLRYEVTIMLPKSGEEGASMLGASLLAVLAVSVVTLVIVLASRSAITSALKAPAMRPLLWLIPVAVFVNGVYQAFCYWSSRSRRFANLSAGRVAGSVTSSVFQLGLGYAGSATASSLIVSSLAGTGISAAMLGAQIVRKDGAVLRKGMRWNRVWQGIVRHRKFPLYGSFSVLLNSISWQLPAILLQRFFSAEVVGFYSLGNRLLRVPTSLVGGSISQVFYQRAAAARVAGNLAEVVEATYRRLITIGFAPTVVLGIVASDLFRVLFGARWAEAGVYTQILSLWTLFWFISSPLSSLFSVLEMQEFGLKLNVLILGTRILSLVAGGLMGNARMALVFFGVSGVFVYGYYSFSILAAAGVPWWSALRDLGAGIAEVTPIAAILIVAKLAGAPAWLEGLVAVLSLAAFFTIVVRRDPALLAMVKSLRPSRS